MAEGKDNPSGSFNVIREYPRSPSSISPGSSRRGSLRSTQPEKTSEPPTPASPPPRLRRKRAASLNTDAANHPLVENLALNSASTISGTNTAGERVCLCQPDPKIPRPRNAFILYRQHYQGQVVAQHPGLANPEISKIIGEQWRAQPAEVKNDWKRLAEEEKQRHQRQYPEYRYQPRRAGTPNRNRRTSSAEDPVRCSKCGGRYISTPNTPLTPFKPPFSPRNERLLPPFTPSQPSSVPSQGMAMDGRACFSTIPTNPPRKAAPNGQTYQRSVFTQQTSAGIQSSSLRKREHEIETISTSPESKHRRFNSHGSQSHPSPSPHDLPHLRMSRPPTSAAGYIDDRRGQFASPGPLVHHQSSGMMEPPPRPSPAMHHFSPIRSPNTFDESLRLPPLQTQIFHSGPSHHRLNTHQRSDSQARSVEAMVMTIPYINKIKILSKISPPLVPPGPTSPVQEMRGLIIAVEGIDMNLAGEVGRFIKEQLSKEPEYTVKTWPATSKESTEKDTTVDTEMTGTNTSISTRSPPSNSPFLAYLDTIRCWHEKSIEIRKFTTTSPGPSTACAPSSSTSPTTATAPAQTKTNAGKVAMTKNKIPIALLPDGFSLSMSDRYASSIPINDAYAPADHWQWMATLWRGIPGPDLTVYVKSVNMEESEGIGEMSKFGGVECRRDCQAVVVRVGVGRENGEAKETEGIGGILGPALEEKTLRRLGFEVLEFVRGGVVGEEGRGGFGRV